VLRKKKEKAATMFLFLQETKSGFSFDIRRESGGRGWAGIEQMLHSKKTTNSLRE
jgi:hypothetical protein